MPHLKLRVWYGSIFLSFIVMLGAYVVHTHRVQEGVSSKNTSVSWSRAVGDVTSAPACVSAQVQNPTCAVDGKGQITLAWSEISDSCHTSDGGGGVTLPIEKDIILTIDQTVNGVSNGLDTRKLLGPTNSGFGCTDSVTLQNLKAGATYYYSIAIYNYPGEPDGAGSNPLTSRHPVNDTIDMPPQTGTFTVPNCVPIVASSAIAENLSSTFGPQISGNVTPIQGATVTFYGEVQNTGSTDINASFVDSFYYRWNSTGGFTQLGGGITKNSLNKNQKETDSATPFSLTDSGTLEVMHCIDVTNKITESDEGPSDNCKVSSFQVASGNASVSACTLPPVLVSDKQYANIGDKAKLLWKTNNHTGCKITGGNENETILVKSGSIDVTVQAKTTYTIACNANASDSVTIDVFGVGFPT